MNLETLEEEAFLSIFLQRYGNVKNINIPAEDLQTIYQELRPSNSISLQQTKAAIETVCLCALCFEEEVLAVLKEMDRRSFLMRDIEWEFEMLDRDNRGTITEHDARFLCRALHGEGALKKWSKFMAGRVLPGSRVSLAEIEVLLCDQQEDLHLGSSDDEEKSADKK